MLKMRLLGVLIACMVGVCFGSPQASMREAEVRELLKKMQTEFEKRPSFAVDFKCEYHLASGTVGANASRAETVNGQIWSADGRLLMRQVDEKWDEEEQKFVPVRDERSAWADGRRVGLRRFLDSHPSEQPFTVAKKFHDTVRPDSKGWFSDGIVFDTEHFSTTLLRCDGVKGEIEPSTGGAQQLHISGTCAEGAMDVWVTGDERHDLMKAKFVTSTAYGKTLNGVTSVTIEVGPVDYVEVGGARFPERAEAMYTFEVPGEGTLKKAILVTRSAYKLNPGSAVPNEFAFQVAEGTEVFDYEDTNAQWEWRDGKLTRLS